jgi:Phosphatidylinositol-glycan biosynthesis class S protein
VEFAYTIVLSPSFQSHPSSTLHHANRTLSIAYPPSQYLGLPDYLSRMILTVFASERRYIRSVLARSANDAGALPEFARRVVRGSSKYQVTFSLLNGGGEQAVESWDIAEALNCKPPPPPVGSDGQYI